MSEIRPAGERRRLPVWPRLLGGPFDGESIEAEARQALHVDRRLSAFYDVSRDDTATARYRLHVSRDCRGSEAAFYVHDPR